MAWHDAVAKIKLPTGTVGKICMMLIAVCFAFATIVVAVHQLWVAILALLLLTTIVLILGLRVMSFADKHPQAALMEGAELLKYEQISQTKYTPARIIETVDKVETVQITAAMKKLAAQPEEETHG